MFEHITQLVRKEQIALFVGSGFSLKAGAPRSSDIISAIKEEMTADEWSALDQSKIKNLDYASNEFLKGRSGGRNLLISTLKQLMTFEKKDISDHISLAKIPHFHHIFTTNYDTLLEDAYQIANINRNVVRNDAGCTYINTTWPSIYKIHGDLDEPNGIILSSSDYDRYFNKVRNPNLWGLAKSCFLKDAIVFIGYSLNDVNIIDIIERIQNAVGENHKPYFLIAPGFDKKRRTMLGKLGVEYFDAVGKDFLDELNKILSDNIIKDFRTHKVSTDTFHKYCNIHDLDPSVILQSNQNVVKELKAVAGKEKRTELNFHVTLPTMDKDNFFDFEKNGVILSNNPLGTSVPVIKLKSPQLQDFSYYENGIRIMDSDDVKELFVVPQTKEGIITIEVPNKDFLETLPFRSYKLNNQKLTMNINCDAFDFSISLSLSSDFTLPIIFNGKVSPKEYYRDNDSAIKWAHFFNYMFSGEDFYLREISSGALNIAKADIDGDASVHAKPYDMFIDYYKMVKRIEMQIHKKFAEYDNFSETNYEMAKIILSYLTHSPVEIKTPQGRDFEFTLEDYTSKENKSLIENGGNYVIAITQPSTSKLKFNGMEFLIPYRNISLNNCTVTSVIKNKNKSARIKIHNNDTVCYYFYGDNPIENKGNCLKLLP